MVIAVVGLGANLADPSAQIRRAVSALTEIESTALLRCSSIYRSAPMGGPAGQPDYANAVALLDTGLAPLELLAALQSIERVLGRVRREHWGPREIDLDLLCMGQLVLRHPRLQLPHPGLAQRDFVLQPLVEIAPALPLPGLGGASECLARLHAPPLPMWSA